ncbi:hypothetical protein ACFFRR_003139 [Megaselia abdita]
MDKSLIFIIILLFICVTKEYDIRLPVREESLCSGQPNCTVGSKSKVHSYCRKSPKKDHASCSVIDISETEENRLLLGINGLRNKFAKDLKIGNMNYVYFEPILARMAYKYLQTCTNDLDICDYIGLKKFNLSQTKMFVNRSRSSITSKRPLGRVLRMWYTEAKNLKNLEEYKKQPILQISNLTVLMYPSACYFGCATSDIDDGYNMLCYFYPKLPKDHFTNYSESVDDKKCSINLCSYERRICSNTFGKLCGYDGEYERWFLIINCEFSFRSK